MKCNSYTWSDKVLKGTFVNLELPSLHADRKVTWYYFFCTVKALKSVQEKYTKKKNQGKNFFPLLFDSNENLENHCVSIRSGFYLRGISSPSAHPHNFAKFRKIQHNSAQFHTIPHNSAKFHEIKKTVAHNSAQHNSHWKPYINTLIMGAKLSKLNCMFTWPGQLLYSTRKKPKTWQLLNYSGYKPKQIIFKENVLLFEQTHKVGIRKTSRLIL